MAKVYVFLADGFEEVEGLTVVDLPRRAGEDVEMVSIMGRKQITGSHNIRVEADSLFEETGFSGGDRAGFHFGARRSGKRADKSRREMGRGHHEKIAADPRHGRRWKGKPSIRLLPGVESRVGLWIFSVGEQTLRIQPGDEGLSGMP